MKRAKLNIVFSSETSHEKFWYKLFAGLGNNDIVVKASFEI